MAGDFVVGTRHIVALVCLQLSAGCGRIGFESLDGDRPDGAILDAGQPIDAGPLSFDLVFQVTNTRSVELGGRCTGTGEVALTGADQPAAACSDSRFTTTASRSEDGLTTVEATQGGVNATAQWLRDTQVPAVTLVSVAEPRTTSRIVATTFSASDNDQVTHFCFDWRGRTPTADASCFVPVNAPEVGGTPAENLMLGPLPFPIGFVAGAYRLQVFVRDRAGNVSPPGATTVDYAPTPPPVVSRVIGSATDSPSDPPALDDLQVAAGAEVFVRWNATDDGALVATRIFTTTDEETMVVAGAFRDCPPSAERNSCRVIRAPAATYFRVRVLVEDDSGQVSSGISPPLNTPLRFMAGTTEPSAGAGAASANIQPYDPHPSTGVVGAGAMVIMDDGTIFLRESSGDVIEISPTTGRIEPVLRRTGASTGDGGSATDATSTHVHRLATAGLGFLYVWDADRIRRIDLSQTRRPIETIIGGGATVGDDVAALELLIEPPNPTYAGRMSFSVSTRGDVFFVADGFDIDSSLHHYDPDTRRVSPLRIRGAWRDGLRYEDCYQSNHFLLHSADGRAAEGVAVVWSSRDSACATDASGEEIADFVRFNALTGEALGVVADDGFSASYYDRTIGYATRGLDGTNYFIGEAETVSRYDVAGDRMVHVAGTGLLGSCADGTPATECDLRVFDVNAARDGSLYMLDNGQIRTLADDGTLLTLIGRSFGPIAPSNDALDHRFFDIRHLQSGAGAITLVDVGSSYMLEVRPGAPVRRLAGNGGSNLPDLGVEADGSPIWTNSSGQFWSAFQRVGDDVYFNRHRDISRLRDNTWSIVAGDGTVPFFDVTTAIPGDQVLFSNSPPNYPPAFLASNGSELLFSTYAYSSTLLRTIYARLMLYNLATGEVSFLAGAAQSNNDFCADGTALDSCNVALSNNLRSAGWSTSLGAWLVSSAGTRSVRTIIAGSPIQTLASFPDTINTIAYDDSRSDVLVSCTLDGRLMQLRISTTEFSPIELGTPTIACTGAMHIDGGMLTFGIEQNGLRAVAEIPLPE